ncbi:MAG TPA: Ppx/GppA phosphatase family protein [Polyangiaceae bacterium]|jgi:exopolyphosphatase/guanosine-5'-triphosphate,3'-diphosphate pyrophosphatase
MRVAAIDIGTNTVLLLVAESDRGALRAVREEATITRLGEGVDLARKLAPAAIERTNACLMQYATIVRELGAERVAVVGTSAMRDAGGGDEVRARVRELFGVEARTISGEEEARLTFAGALSGLDASGRVAVFDVGGGSTEVVVGERGGSLASRSFDVGSVRLTERHVKSDPPTREEIDAMTRDAKSAFATDAQLFERARGLSPIGIAGTVTTLAAVALGLAPYDGGRVHGHVMPLEEIRSVVERLASLPLAERREVRGLEPKRADVIVAGGIVVLAALDALGANAMRVSDRGVRWGLAETLAGAS